MSLTRKLVRTHNMEDVGIFLARPWIGAVHSPVFAGFAQATPLYLLALRRLLRPHCYLSSTTTWRKIHDLTSLRLLGTVAINTAAWNWHSEHVGKRECTVVDTFWWVRHIPWCPLTLNTHRQAETGSIVATPLPGAIETKPGSVTVPSFGIQPTIPLVAANCIDVIVAAAIKKSA